MKNQSSSAPAETTAILVASRKIGIARTTTYTLVRENRYPLPVLWVGSRLRVLTADLDALLAPAAAAE